MVKEKLDDQIVKKKYVYNKKQHTLHLTNYCKVQGNPCFDNNWLYFETYDEACALDGESVHFCKTCAKKRDTQENKQKEN